MIETAFLDAVSAFLAGAGLSPAPAAIGVAEPATRTDLPCVVLSLEAAERPSSGLGERSTLITDGVLEWHAVVDLANPALPNDPTFLLVSGDRLGFTLPHGGLVRSDGTRGALATGDLTIRVDGVPRTLVGTTPSGNQFSADPDAGQLTFGTPLPASGTLEATYFLGQWEQRTSRLTGTLRVDVCAETTSAVVSLSDSILERLTGPQAASTVRRILSIALKELSSVGGPEAVASGGGGGPSGQGSTLRRRTARFRFLYERVVDAPESSGGIILRIPVLSQTDSGGEEAMTVSG